MKTAILILLLLAGVVMAEVPETHIEPQTGPQADFLLCNADVAVGGGGAGGGKTMALLWQPLNHIQFPRFGAVIFRRTYQQITAEGGLWDQSQTIYRPSGGVPREGYRDWRFPSGAKIRFAHMQHEDDRYAWDGSEVPLICFDQAESFTWKQVSYMFSRNRSTCGVNPYIRMTCNPDPDSWLRSFLSWWIDDETGLAIPERSGKIRYFVNLRNEIHWADDKKTLRQKFGQDSKPKSCTFIPSSVFDNKILLKTNPGYLSSLEALPMVDRMRLLGCNWNVRESAGLIFKRAWFEIADAAPQLNDCIRYWDRAGTPAMEIKSDKASHTAGVKMGVDRNGTYWVLDVVRFQESPLKVQQQIANTASQDGRNIRVGIEQDPGQAGKAEAEIHIRNLAGYVAHVNTVREAKGVRAKPVSAQAEAGNIRLVRGKWNEDYLRELENFDGSDNCVADQVDATSGAFHMLTNKKRAGVW